MLVSVIIPAFNREKTIRRAVESVFAQTHPSLEIIVVDDGSSDGTTRVLAEYGAKIRVISQKNAGASAARNTGIRAATGEIIAFLDSDDEWRPTKIARQVALLIRPNMAHVTCCICNTELIHLNGIRKKSFTEARLHPTLIEGIWANPMEVLLTRFLLFNQAVAVRRSALDQAGYFREDLRVMEDYDFALRLSVTGPWAFVSDPLVIWYGGTDNSLASSASRIEVYQYSQKILADFCRSPAGSTVASHPLMKERLRFLRVLLWALPLANKPHRLPRLFGCAMLRFLQLYESLFRRMPSFPKMRIQSA